MGPQVFVDQRKLDSLPKQSSGEMYRRRATITINTSVSLLVKLAHLAFLKTRIRASTMLVTIR